MCDDAAFWACIILALFYVLRRLYWLGMTSYADFVTGDEDESKKTLRKANDWIQIGLLGLMALILFGWSFC